LTRWLLLFFCLAGCNRPDAPVPLQSAPTSKVYAATIHQPEKLASVETGQVDALGRPVRVACATCHTLRSSDALPARAEDLKQFHRGLRFQHGELSCASCHRAGKHDTLRLADGQEIPMLEAMRLCAQCHGPQSRDYKRGSHGGMTGYWDLSRGPRTRNNCVDCHDPHAPAYPGTTPVLPPRDRGAHE
jgi:hypothetical protein